MSESRLYTMSEPGEIGLNTRYGFNFTTANKRLLRVIQEVPCVYGVLRTHRGKFLIELRDEHDPDEAWHWVRTEIEEFEHFLEVDGLWGDAIWL